MFNLLTACFEVFNGDRYVVRKWGSTVRHDTYLKARQMGRCVNVSLWCESLSTNSRFRVLYFRMNNFKSRSNVAPFSNQRHFEICFQKWKQLHFSEENDLNYTKKTHFCRWQLHVF